VAVVVGQGKTEVGVHVAVVVGQGKTEVGESHA
jgi:hypothetical protein